MPTAALVAGASLGAFGSVMGGLQTQQESKSEAIQLQQQGQIAATNASGEIAANDIGVRRDIGALNTGAAASGVRSNSGSVNAVRSMNESMGILRDTYARYRGQVGEQGSYYQARAARYQGTQAAYAGVLGAGSSLLTAGFNYDYMRRGVGTPNP